MDQGGLEALQARVRYLEDESAITRLIMSYGPAADAGLTSFAGHLWLEDGVYDWDAEGDAHLGSAAVDAMLQGDNHQGLIARGVAHFAGPLLIDLDGDRATALNYSLIMRREQDRHYRLARERGPMGRRARGFAVASAAKDEPAARRVGRGSPVVR